MQKKTKGLENDELDGIPREVINMEKRNKDKENEVFVASNRPSMLDLANGIITSKFETRMAHVEPVVIQASQSVEEVSITKITFDQGVGFGSPDEELDELDEFPMKAILEGW